MPRLKSTTPAGTVSGMGARLTYVRVCPQCHQRFEVPFPEEWVYRERRSGGRPICSWRCLRAWEKDSEAGRRRTM